MKYFYVLFLLIIECMLLLPFSIILYVFFGPKYNTKLTLYFYSIIINKTMKINEINKEYYNTEIIKHKQLILGFNHQTLYDITLFAKFSKNFDLITIMKNSLLFVPFLGVQLFLSGYFFINRKKSHNLVVNVSNYLLKHNYSLVIAPEGTRYYDGEFHHDKLKSGMFAISMKADIPIVPIYHNLGEKYIDKTFTVNENKNSYIIYGNILYPKDYKTLDEYKQKYINEMLRIKEQFNTIQ